MENVRDEQDGMQFFRGLLIGMALGAASWALIVFAVVRWFHHG